MRWLFETGSQRRCGECGRASAGMRVGGRRQPGAGGRGVTNSVEPGGRGSGGRGPGGRWLWAGGLGNPGNPIFMHLFLTGASELRGFRVSSFRGVSSFGVRREGFGEQRPCRLRWWYPPKPWILEIGPGLHRKQAYCQSASPTRIAFMRQTKSLNYEGSTCRLHEMKALSVTLHCST